MGARHSRGTRLMNFLEICQRVRQEVGAAGVGPASVLNQTGELKRIVDWVATADGDIQRKYNQWKFMTASFSLNTVASDASYNAADFLTPVTDLRDFRRESLKIYTLSAGVQDETKIYYMEYQDWYEIYGTGLQSTGRPLYYAVGNDMSLKLGPVPNEIFRMSGEYQKAVTLLSANNNTPPYPEEFHMLPVYLAMKKYGRYTGATELYEDGEREYKKMLIAMERSQLPKIRMGCALA